MNHLCIEAGYCKTLGRQHEARQDSNVNTNSPNFNTGSRGMQQMTKNKAAAAVYISLVLLAILGFLIFNGSAFVAMSRNGILPFSINDARFFTLILNAKALLSLFISSLPGIKYIFSKKWSPIKIKLSGTQIDVDFGKSVLADLLCNYCGVFTSYFSCWMLIGIMLNPTWGLTVTLLICFTFAAFTYAVYEYLTVFSREKGDKPNNWHALYPCVLGMLAVIFLIVIIVFAGQSYNGRETADETLKTTLLSALGAFVSWLSWKRLLNISQDLKEKQTQCPTSDSSTNCDYTHGQPSNAGDSLTGNGHATDNTNNIDHTQTQPPAEGDLAMVNGQTTKQIPSSSSDTSINSGNIQREATLGGDSSTDSATATEVHHPLFSGTCTNTQDIRRQSPLRGDSSTEVVVVVDIHQPPSHPTSTTKGQIRRLPPSAENNQSIDPNENLEIESSL